MKVSPSILTCDFAHGADAIRFVEASGADLVHLDVMDGVFVPNLSFGPAVIASLRPYTRLPFDVHLMMQHPDRLIDAFAKAGADSVNIHLECADPIEDTPAEAVFPYLGMVDMVLVMTVEPGFGGQSFMADMMPKVTALRREIDRQGLSVHIEVDGGIGEKTAPVAAAAGADVAVIGSALFNAAEPERLVRLVQAL